MLAFLCKLQADAAPHYSLLLQVKAGNRVNRATVAIFKFENGSVGSLNHTLLMHGSNFFTEMDIYGDGFAIAIKDPYQHPAVFVRRPHSDDLVEASHYTLHPANSDHLTVTAECGPYMAKTCISSALLVKGSAMQMVQHGSNCGAGPHRQGVRHVRKAVCCFPACCEDRRPKGRALPVQRCGTHLCCQLVDH